MDSIYNDQDDLIAYVFHPDDEDDIFPGDRPLKRRRTKKSLDLTTSPSKLTVPPPTSLFVPLLSGQEEPAHTELRERLFRSHWERIEARINKVLRDANERTLGNVMGFLQGASEQKGERVPAAFVITGPNIAAQGLLFEQLEERLVESMAVVVRMRSVEVTTAKAALKYIVRGITGGPAAKKKTVTTTVADEVDDDEEGDLTMMEVAGEVERYLDYDLAALAAWVEEQRAQGKPVKHVVVAFQDGEGFDSALLSDLVRLFASWPSIPFSLLFGIATSTEMLQARLLKSTCRLLFGAQFDMLQSMSILERVFRAVVAAPDVPMTLGPVLLRSFIDRQQDHVAGIQAFVNALKYAYMCHFYANPLSVLLASPEEQGELPMQLLEGVKSMPSFHLHVEALVAVGELQTAKALLVDKEVLIREVRAWISGKVEWAARLIVATEIVCIVEKRSGTAAYIEVYAELLAEGIVLGPDSPTMALLKPMGPPTIKDIIKRFIKAVKGPLKSHVTEDTLRRLTELKEKVKATVATAAASGHRIHSVHSSPTKASRTTIIAQKVVLAIDNTALTDHDHAFTAHIQTLSLILSDMVRFAGDANPMWNPNLDDEPVIIQPAIRQVLNEAWIYDSRTPHRDVFVPRPRMVFERGLTRPQDYLACICCSAPEVEDTEGQEGDVAVAGKKKGVPPATCVLYKLYLEAGTLVNVADLWKAFRGAFGKIDEREALALFYRGLAELRLLGFLKASRKKADHIAKVKWM